jgi:hypothetical protein
MRIVLFENDFPLEFQNRYTMHINEMMNNCPFAIVRIEK